MQEGTGRWHVQTGGPSGRQWQAATPPGRPPSIKRIASVALAALTSGALCTCLVALVVLAGTGGLRLPALPGIGPGATPVAAPAPGSAAPTLTYRLLETQPVPADGAWHTDARGAGMQVPAAVLPGGEGARVESYEASGAALESIGRSYRLETPFYRVAAQGRNDSIGRATLRLPAAGPDSRILVMIGDKPAAVLDVLPKNGFLELPVRVAPAEADAWPAMDPKIRGDADQLRRGHAQDAHGPGPRARAVGKREAGRTTRRCPFG